MSSEKLLVIYNRESTQQQAQDGYNLIEQENKARAYIEFEEFKNPIKVLNEDGQSAKTLNRPKMNELIDLVKSKKVEYIIIYSLDRLTRRLGDLDYLLRLFIENDVDLISIKDKIDLSTAIGRFFVHIIGSIAEWEEDTISERTINGMIGGAKLGNYIFGGTPPFGYKRISKYEEKEIHGNVREVKKSGIEPDEITFPLVRKIFDWAIQGYSALKIRNTIRKDKDFVEAKITISEDAIKRIIKNPIYHGEIFFRNEYFELDCETLLTKEQQELAIKNSSWHMPERVNQYIFKSKVYDLSGTLLKHTASNKTLSNGDIRVYKYYEDENKNRINEQILIDYISKHGVLLTEKVAPDILAAKKKLDKQTEEKRKLFCLYNTEQITFDNYMEKLKMIEEQSNILKCKIEKYQSEAENMRKDGILTAKSKAILISENISKIVVDLKMKSVVDIQYLML